MDSHLLQTLGAMFYGHYVRVVEVWFSIVEYDCCDLYGGVFFFAFNWRRAKGSSYTLVINSPNVRMLPCCLFGCNASAAEAAAEHQRL